MIENISEFLLYYISMHESLTYGKYLSESRVCKGRLCIRVTEGMPFRFQENNYQQVAHESATPFMIRLCRTEDDPDLLTNRPV
jgi:hypothetical protein